MSSPLDQAGATREPSEYAALSMDRGITGLWTQRSPLRDADVPYLYGKFYSASRFDSLIDGINREISAKLTYRRRPGSSVYNSNTFPAINSFYAFKRIVNGSEVVRVIADGADGTVYDATAGQKTALFTKGSGAGKARFQGVGTTLFFTDGVENKKWLQPGPWQANTSLVTTQYAVGSYILDSNGNIEYLSSVTVGSITSVQVSANTAILKFSTSNFNIQPGMSFSAAGLTGASFLNFQRLVAASVTLQAGSYVVTAQFVYAGAYAATADSGTASTNDSGTLATTGSLQPTWSTGLGVFTTDGASTWQRAFSGAVYDWSPSPPLTQPTVSAITYGSGSLQVNWQPLTAYSGNKMLMAANGDPQVLIGSGLSGATLPDFEGTSYGPNTQDGTAVWQGAGVLGQTLAQVGQKWAPSAWFASRAPAVNRTTVIVDPNGNLQVITAGSGNTGTTQPTWSTVYGAGTTDNGLTWTNFGPYLPIAYQGDLYAYAYEAVDGSVSSLSPLSAPSYGMIGGAQIGGAYSTDAQVVNVLIFRTADGEPTPLQLARFQNLRLGGIWSFSDIYNDSVLNAEESGPQNEANNPPPVGMTAPLYHLGRIWAIYQNGVVVSGGPNTLVGNGNTAFPPGNFFPIPEQPIRLFPTITSAGPALLIFGRVNRYIILGNGTPSNPFQSAAQYQEGGGILSYDAVCKRGTTFYLFGDTAKVGGNLVGKALSLDPGTGETEFGFPIGDQFESVTTGAGGRIANSGAPLGYLYNPANTFVTYADLGSSDTGIYVCDGSIGWFRCSPVASPESGFLWSPRAVIVGGTSAVQAIETQPGVTQLLIGPATSGPILFRDSTVNADNGTAYPSYDVKGCIQMCQTGEVAEIAHVHLVSMPQGARPYVGLLFDEIMPTSPAPFAWYSRTSAEPPTLAASETVYSDRYTMLQNGVTPKCMFFQLGMDYGTQNVPDETLMFSVFGAKYAERKQQ